MLPASCSHPNTARCIAVANAPRSQPSLGPSGCLWLVSKAFLWGHVSMFIPCHLWRHGDEGELSRLSCRLGLLQLGVEQQSGLRPVKEGVRYPVCYQRSSLSSSPPFSPSCSASCSPSCSPSRLSSYSSSASLHKTRAAILHAFRGRVIPPNLADADLADADVAAMGTLAGSEEAGMVDSAENDRRGWGAATDAAAAGGGGGGGGGGGAGVGETMMSAQEVSDADEKLSSRLPPEFVQFLRENGIDPSGYDLAATLPRYIRLKLQPEDNSSSGGGCNTAAGQNQILLLEDELKTKLSPVAWLPGLNFFSLPAEASLASSSLYRSGKVFGLDAASGAAVAALGIQPGDDVLDLCAAPGAKLCLMADLLSGTGTLTGVDVSPRRLAACRTMLKKYGVGSRCRLFLADGTKFLYGPPFPGTRGAGEVKGAFVAERKQEEASLRGEKEGRRKRGDEHKDGHEEEEEEEAEMVYSAGNLLQGDTAEGEGEGGDEDESEGELKIKERHLGPPPPPLPAAAAAAAAASFGDDKSLAVRDVSAGDGGPADTAGASQVDLERNEDDGGLSREAGMGGAKRKKTRKERRRARKHRQFEESLQLSRERGGGSWQSSALQACGPSLNGSKGSLLNGPLEATLADSGSPVLKEGNEMSREGNGAATLAGADGNRDEQHDGVELAANGNADVMRGHDDSNNVILEGTDDIIAADEDVSAICSSNATGDLFFVGRNSHEWWDSARPCNPQGYDKVLVDAECTHDGSLRHVEKFDSPSGWASFSSRFLDRQRLDSLAKLQRNLLLNGFRLLKVGGTLVYSTCSLTRSQNEDVVRWFLERHKGVAEVEPIQGAENWPCKPGGVLHSLRFDPETSNTSGLFIVSIRKLKGG